MSLSIGFAAESLQALSCQKVAFGAVYFVHSIPPNSRGAATASRLDSMNFVPLKSLD